jgi:hypothetical protein
MEGIKGWVSEGHVLKHKPTNHMYLGCYHYIEEIPENAIRSEGISTTGLNLLLNSDFPSLEERQVYEIILIPKRKF